MKRAFCDRKMNGIYFVRLLFKTNLKEYQSNPPTPPNFLNDIACEVTRIRPKADLFAIAIYISKLCSHKGLR